MKTRVVVVVVVAYCWWLLIVVVVMVVLVVVTVTSCFCRADGNGDCKYMEVMVLLTEVEVPVVLLK